MICYSVALLQLETTAERIKAVDHAAAMVEEMLKQPISNSGVKVSLSSMILQALWFLNLMTNFIWLLCVPQVDHLLSICIFLGFEVDPLVDIASRIRGPNVRFSLIHLHWLFCLIFCASFSISVCAVHFVFPFSCKWVLVGYLNTLVNRKWMMSLGCEMYNLTIFPPPQSSVSHLFLLFNFKARVFG